MDQYKVDVPEGKVGNWTVSKFTVSQEDSDFDRLRGMFSFGGCGRYTPPGTYTSLKNKGATVMSDTPDEIRDHRGPMIQAKGRCLINGLGLGVVLNGMLMKKEVEHVDVIERSPEVIELVAEHWRKKWGNRFTVIEADALEYTPPKGVRYGAVWHDIWTDISAENLKDMHKLHRKYGRRAEWQGSWCRHLCERYRGY